MLFSKQALPKTLRNRKEYRCALEKNSSVNKLDSNPLKAHLILVLALHPAVSWSVLDDVLTQESRQFSHMLMYRYILVRVR